MISEIARGLVTRLVRSKFGSDINAPRPAVLNSIILYGVLVHRIALAVLQKSNTVSIRRILVNDRCKFS